MQPNEPPSPILGRDRSPSGPPLWWSVSAVVRLGCAVVRVCGRGAFGEIALSRKCVGEVFFWRFASVAQSHFQTTLSPA